ncbi:MAG TPA: TIGR00300 family protein [Chthoniobacterales bacterium]|jgi:lysine-ketoglutarate reductase/saccharopine dehydrogenase-like protein (TIGR00300 family)
MVSETVELRGHIIDSLILPKVLDAILTSGGDFKIGEIKIGQNRVDQSYARVEVSAPTGEALDELLLRLRQHGAEAMEKKQVQLAPARVDGVFPRDFYVTTNQQTFVRLGEKDVEVRPSMMDSAIAVDREKRTARAVKFFDVRKGDEIVVGHQGVRVVPLQRSTSRTDIFNFINSSVSAERPKSALIRELAAEMKRIREADGKILVVGGPAIVHTGAAEYLEDLIKRGYVQRLFAGNGLAVYDVESVLYGTSLGVDLERSALVDRGHENHMRAINTIREAGGIAQAVEKQVLTRGVMHACVKNGVDILLSGSIRDDGPIPGVNTDALEAQKLMREKVQDIALVLMMGTMLHSIAVSNMLSSGVKIVMVDIDPSAVAKITDAQAFQSIGLVTDVEPFLRELTACLTVAENDGAAAK